MTDAPNDGLLDDIPAGEPTADVIEQRLPADPDAEAVVRRPPVEDLEVPEADAWEQSQPTYPDADDYS
jgi:hypothetical protein